MLQRLGHRASGIVDQLSVFTIGGIAEAGAELLRIVPTDAEIEIEATFSNQDIGFMSVDQQANIGLHAYPSERFGFLGGRVNDIAADSTETSDRSMGLCRKNPTRSNVSQNRRKTLHHSARNDRFDKCYNR